MEKTPEEIFAEKMAAKIDESKGLITAEVKAMIEDHAKGNAEKMAELEETAKKQGEAITEMLKKQAAPAKVIGLKEAIRTELTAKFAGKTLEEVKGMMGKGVEINIKAAGTFLTSTHTTGQVQSFEVDPMLDAAPQKKLFLRDVVGATSTSSETIIVREKYNEDGDAAWVAEGSIKSLVDFDMRTQTYHAKMIDATTEVGENSLNDIADLMSEIEKEIIYKIELKEQHGELFGTGAANDPVGLTVIASAFVLTSMADVVEPNRTDALIACDTQLKTMNFAGNFVAINPVDAGLMKLQKDEMGGYILDPARPELAGYKVIESNDIPVGYFLLGDGTKTNIKDYEALNIKFNYSGTGFADGIVTIRGTKRIHAYTKTQNQPAFIYDSFVNVIGAITKVTA